MLGLYSLDSIFGAKGVICRSSSYQRLHTAASSHGASKGCQIMFLGIDVFTRTAISTWTPIRLIPTWEPMLTSGRGEVGPPIRPIQDCLSLIGPFGRVA